MTLYSVWKRKSTQRFHAPNQAHHIPTSLLKAKGKRLDEIGRQLGLERETALMRAAQMPTPYSADEVYRYELMTILERLILELMSNEWSSGSRTVWLEHYAELLGLERRIAIYIHNGVGVDDTDEDLHSRCMHECSVYFDGPPPHLRPSLP